MIIIPVSGFSRQSHKVKLMAMFIVWLSVLWLDTGDWAAAQGPGDPEMAHGDAGASAEVVQFLPLLGNDISVAYQVVCHDIAGSTFEVLNVLPPPTDRPPTMHADLNLALRGYDSVRAHQGYVWLEGPTDYRAPQLKGLFRQERLPEIVGTHQVYDWDWECNCRHDLLDSPEVTLASVTTDPAEIITVPGSGYGLGSGYEVLVLYAQPGEITLKYTREDNVVIGYTLHLQGICVEEDLLALYQQSHAQGRSHLPALKAGQAFARAKGHAIRVVIRDSGSFMDPRSLKDWWRE